MPAFKRGDWNAIIQKVNSLIDNGCAGGTKLVEVGPNHVFTKSDIQQVRDTLTAMCSSHPQFTEKLTTWRQSIINELNAAIDGCRCGATITARWFGQVRYGPEVYPYSELVISRGVTSYDAGTSSVPRTYSLSVIRYGSDELTPFINIVPNTETSLVENQSVPVNGIISINYSPPSGRTWKPYDPSFLIDTLFYTLTIRT